MKSKKAITFAWEIIAKVLIYIALAILLLLAFPAIAEGFQKALNKIFR